MRTTLFILTLVFLSVGLNGTAQQTVLNKQEKKKPVPKVETPQQFTRIFKTNLLTMVWGPIPFTAEYRLSYEFISARNQASELSFSYLGRSPFLRLVENDSANIYDIKYVVSGFRFQAAHKFYLKELSISLMGDHFEYAPKGLYLAPHISYSTAKFTDKFYNQYDIYVRGSHFNINFRGGFQFFLLDFVAIDVFAGLGYKKNTWEEHITPSNITRAKFQDELPDFYNGPVKLTLGFNMGIGL